MCEKQYETIQVTTQEKEILRTLAKEYMQVASLPVQREKMELWKAFNRLDHTRPLITINQLPWHELNYDGSLTCHVQNRMLRKVEETMRKTLYQWKHFPVDMVVEPYLTIPFCASNSGYGIEVVENTSETDSANDIISHDYVCQFETDEDVEKIKPMQITLSEKTSQEWKECAEEIFDGIIPIHQAGGVFVRLPIWDVLAELMGIEEVFCNLIDEPERIHAIMERMTQSALSGIDQCNALGLFNTSAHECHCSVVYNDTLLPDFMAGIGNDSAHTWGCSMAQIFTSVSPQTTKEFEIDYMKRISSKFGMFYYGCCERLDDRLDFVQELPNLKKVSCSPWSNHEQFAERLRKDLIMSAKPTPAHFAAPSLDLDTVEKGLVHTCDCARKNGLQLELLLKDLSTVQYKPEHLTQWAQRAMQIAQRYE